MGIYRHAVRPLLFRLDPEWTHNAGVGLCAAVGRQPLLLRALDRLYGGIPESLACRVADIEFRSPVGLAAGFDKNGEAVRTMSRLGAGFVEVGSVSEQASAGNARPRVWRLPEDEALRIHYGCPNDGAERIADRLSGLRLPVPLGVNIVETNTGFSAATQDVCREMALACRRFVGIADYLVLNLSCPNLPPNCQAHFQDPEAIRRLLESCGPDLPPTFLKLTPAGDPTDPREIDRILEAVSPFGFVRGFILNIPVANPARALRTAGSALARTRGGITGPCLLEPTLAAIRAGYARIDRDRHVLIGAGGIRTGDDAWRYIRAGAHLVQIYTALVYRGPSVFRDINLRLAELGEREGFSHVAEAVGVDHRNPKAILAS